MPAILNAMFPSGFIDPLEVTCNVLETYSTDMKKKAEDLSNTIRTRSQAVSDVNLKWNIIYKYIVENSKASDPDSKARVGSGPDANATFNSLEDAMKTALADGSTGLVASTLRLTINDSVSNAEGQTMNASVGAFCDKIQADISSLQNEFKNIMNQVSSGLDEVKNLRQSIISLCTLGSS